MTSVFSRSGKIRVIASIASGDQLYRIIYVRQCYSKYYAILVIERYCATVCAYSQHRDIENVPHPVFGNIFPSLVFICLDSNGKLSIFVDYTEFCIFISRTVILVFPLLHYFLAI